MKPIKSVKLGRLRIGIYMQDSSFWIKAIFLVIIIHLVIFITIFILNHTDMLNTLLNENIGIIKLIFGLSMTVIGGRIIVKNFFK
jgi:small neutral amino acid transporter SnatA (MarC family)